MFAPQPVVAAAPPPKIVGVDWSLGVTASSSELQAVGTTFVSLRLHTQSTDGTAEYVHLGARAKHRNTHISFAMLPDASATSAADFTARRLFSDGRAMHTFDRRASVV